MAHFHTFFLLSEHLYGLYPLAYHGLIQIAKGGAESKKRPIERTIRRFLVF